MRHTAPSEDMQTNVTPYKFGAFDQYVSFSALGGLITTEDGKLSRMTTSQFCQQWSVDRKTTYRWKRSKGFASKVRVRREELFPLARETACWNRLYLIGLQSDDLKAAVEAIKILLGHFGGLQLPAKRSTMTNASNSTNWVELLNIAKQKNVID